MFQTLLKLYVLQFNLRLLTFQSSNFLFRQHIILQVFIQSLYLFFLIIRLTFFYLNTFSYPRIHLSSCKHFQYFRLFTLLRLQKRAKLTLRKHHRTNELIVRKSDKIDDFLINITDISKKHRSLITINYFQLSPIFRRFISTISRLTNRPSSDISHILNREIKFSLTFRSTFTQNIISATSTIFPIFHLCIIRNILITRSFIIQSKSYSIQNGSLSRTGFTTYQEKWLLCQDTIGKINLCVFNRIQVLYYQLFNLHNQQLTHITTLISSLRHKHS